MWNRRIFSNVIKLSKMKDERRSNIISNCIIGFILLVLSTMFTTCAFHDKMKYNNIKKVAVVMVVEEEVYRSEGRGGGEDNFYLRVKSPFISTPEPDYLIRTQDCPMARKNDTLICLVKMSNSLKDTWYSHLSFISETEDEQSRKNQGLFIIERSYKKK